MGHFRDLFLLSVLPFALVSCDGDGGSDGDDVSGGKETAELPMDFDAVKEEQAGSDGAGADAGLEAVYAGEVFEKINDYRRGRGLSELGRDSRIDSLCADHNLTMAAQTRAAGGSEIVISHDGFQQRANVIFAYGYHFVGENVAAVRGYSSSRVTDTFVSNWLESSLHRDNIENDFTHTGVSVYVDESNGTIFVTQMFGRR